MRIKKVEAIPLSYPEPNDFNAIRYLCLAKVTDYEGRVGWGEAITQFREATLATRVLIDELGQLLINKNPLSNVALWHQIKDAAWWYGYRGGILSYALAAIDMALWDLKGKVLNCTVLDLLGGPVKDRIPAISSSHAHHEKIEAIVEEIQSWMSTGLHGVKVAFGKRGNARLGIDFGRDVEFVKSLRGALGDDKLIMIDLGVAIKWDVATAIKRVKAFEDYNITWIEEPLGAYDPGGYAALRSHTNTLLAYGEREWTIYGYEEILSSGTVDVVGCDPARAEGITGFKKVTERCEYYKRYINAHAWSSAICSAASLALSFATPASWVFELKPLKNPMQHELVTEPITHKEGWMYPLQKPGLGIEIIEEVVDHYRATE